MADGFDPGFEERGKMDNNIDARMAIGVLNQIDEKYRSVVLMRYIDDLSPKEIADVTGVTEVTVRNRSIDIYEKFLTRDDLRFPFL